ncbi:MAG: hypothetical protein H7Z41_02605 [Cytophagales bacterium]|nr:hypothetical protein [Armatimonadota bacterium]
MGTLENSQPLPSKRGGKNPAALPPSLVPVLTPPQTAITSDVRVRRAVIFVLGSLLLVVNAYFGTYAYVVAQAMLWTQTSLPRGPVVMLFALVMGNLLTIQTTRLLSRRKAGRGPALSQQELVLLYAMLCMGTCAGGFGLVQQLINQMVGPFHADFATSSSKFKELIWPNVPTWLAPRDPGVLNGFFRGNSTLYDPVVLSAWLVPVLAWSAFFFAIFWTLLCATTLMRRSWVEEERLTFPLVLLPLEMTERGGDSPFWKNRLMWAGFLIAGLLESLNFLNFLFPVIPSLPIKPGMPGNEIGTLFTTRPMNAMGRLTLAFYPFAIGIGYLLALDVSFSCWFLYLMSKASLVFCAAAGLSDGGAGPANRAPFLREQSVGAFLGIAFFSAWAARRTLARAWEEMKRPTGYDQNELMPYRLAILGGGVGLLAMCAFLIAIGFSVLMAAIFVFLYVCIALTLARIVSEAGAGWAWAPPWSPAAFTGDAIGINQLSGRQITALLGYTTFMSDMRDNPMPQQMQAMKIGQGTELPPRAFLAPIVWASALGILCAFWAHLDLYYVFGAATAKVRPALSNNATSAARSAVTMITTPTFQDLPGLGAVGAGALLAVGLSLARQLLPWWPLHPLGYALATTTSMEYMWCPFLIAWIAKRVTLKYGGIKAYRAALPFFLGLILGDYVVPALWGLFGLATNSQQYMSFPH